MTYYEEASGPMVNQDKTVNGGSKVRHLITKTLNGHNNLQTLGMCQGYNIDNDTKYMENKHK